MARKETVAAFEKWIANGENVDIVIELMSGGMTLRDAAMALKIPPTCLYGYFQSTPERLERYEAAKRAWAAAKKDIAFEIAENVKPERDEIAKAKLQIDVIDNQAKAFDPNRWADRMKVEKSVSVSVDVGPATRILEEARKRKLEAIDVPLLEEKRGG